MSDTWELCETLQDLLQDTVKQCINKPAISADQWDLARLPIQARGLYLPHLPSLAVIARTAALATMPRASHTTRYRQNLLQEERMELFARLRGFCHTEPTAVAGNLDWVAVRQLKLSCLRCDPYLCQCQLWSPVVFAWGLAPLKLIEQYLARSSRLNIFSQARPKPCLCEDPSVCDCSSVGLALVSSCMFADVFLLVNPAISKISYSAIIPYCKRISLWLSSAQSRTIFKKPGKLPELSKSMFNELHYCSCS